MAHSVTFDDVWKMFQEMVQENRQRSRELGLQFQETERRFQETDRKFQETDKMLKEVSLANRKLQENIDNLGGKWGRFLEGFVAPACETIFAARGIPVHEVVIRSRKRLPDGRTMEVDLLVIDHDVAVLVEVKSTLGVGDVKRHLERLANFKEFFPRYADCQIMGAVIGIDSEEHAEEFARNVGLFVLTHSGNDIRIANPVDFIPKRW